MQRCPAGAISCVYVEAFCLYEDFDDGQVVVGDCPVQG